MNHNEILAAVASVFEGPHPEALELRDKLMSHNALMLNTVNQDYVIICSDDVYIFDRNNQPVDYHLHLSFKWDKDVWIGCPLISKHNCAYGMFVPDGYQGFLPKLLADRLEQPACIDPYAHLHQS